MSCCSPSSKSPIISYRCAQSWLKNRIPLKNIRNTKPVTIVLRLTPNPPWKLQSHHNSTFTHTQHCTSHSWPLTPLDVWFNKTQCHQNECTCWKPHNLVSVQSHAPRVCNFGLLFWNMVLTVLASAAREAQTARHVTAAVSRQLMCFHLHTVLTHITARIKKIHSIKHTKKYLALDQIKITY